jgi:pantoate--beta-alanine ligase
MIERVNVIGARGRVGSAVSPRLAERGIVLGADEPELVLLCVPDRAIAEVARGIAPGPWIAHVSGATPLAALDPHVRRFSMHPLQSFSKARGPEQLDGAWAAVTAETAAAREAGVWLAETLGLRPFVLDDELRAPYHAGAAVASNYLVTLRSIAGSLLEAAGAPPEALEPLMRGVIDGGFELTGPIARGDWETVDRHLGAIREHRPELARLYVVLAEATAALAGQEAPSSRLLLGAGGRSGVQVCRTVAAIRTELAERRFGSIGLVPTMGALHEGHVSLLRAARAECDTVVLSLFVNPTQFGDPADLAGYPGDEERDLAVAADEGVDLVFAPAREEMYPAGFQTWVEVTELGRILEGEFRPGHFRGVATVVLKLFSALRPDRAYFGQKDAQQVEVVRRMVTDLALEVELRVVPTVRDADGLALSSRNALLSPEERQRALALPRALATKDLDAAREALARSNGLVVEYLEKADFDPPVLAGAVRVGSTRLIDNVVLDEGGTE